MSLLLAIDDAKERPQIVEVGEQGEYLLVLYKPQQVASSVNSIVYRARLVRAEEPEEPGIPVVVKVPFENTRYGRSCLEREIEAGKHYADHPSIVRVYGGKVSKRESYVITEEAKATLKLFLRKGGLLPTRQTIEEFTLSLLDALETVHTDNYLERGPHLHRDVKPDNIFLYRCESGFRFHTKLGDFGMWGSQKEAEEQWERFTIAGTPNYATPDIGETPPSPSSDLYALGLVIYQIVAKTEILPEYPQRMQERNLEPLQKEPLHPILVKALAQRESQRYHSTGEMRRDILQAQSMLKSRNAVYRQQVPLA